MYTEQQLKDLLRQQRENIADLYHKEQQEHFSYNLYCKIKFAPEPELPEAKPILTEEQIQQLGIDHANFYHEKFKRAGLPFDWEACRFDFVAGYKAKPIEAIAHPPLTDEQIEQAACKFAEWLQENRWFHFNRDAKKWYYTFEHGTAMSDKAYQKNYVKTTAELFEKFTAGYKAKPIEAIAHPLVEGLRQVAVEFYYHWHNMQGTNTAKGFDDWWKVNADKFAFLADLKALAVQPTAFERLKAKVTPEHREAAKQKLDRLEAVQPNIPEGFNSYQCTNCTELNIKRNNGQIRVGFCDNCEHPLWNDSTTKVEAVQPKVSAEQSTILTEEDFQELADELKAEKGKLTEQCEVCGITKHPVFGAQCLNDLCPSKVAGYKAAKPEQP